MNVGRMMEFGSQLMGLEAQGRIQKKLQTVSARIQDIITAPQEASHQTATLSAVTELQNALLQIQPDIDQPALEFLIETGGNPYFLPVMGDDIEDQVRSSGITPAVAKSYVDELLSRRSAYLEHLKNASNNLRALKFTEYEIPEGQAEIGFKIPRTLFENKLGAFADELSFIDFTVFTFSEAVTGEKQEGQLAQLSTSDPVVLVTAGVHVIAAMAASVKWLMDAYAKHLEILKLRADLQAIGMPQISMKQVEKIAEEKLQAAIEAAVEKVLKKRATGRLAEVGNALRIALRGLIARIERGMTIEVRFLPAPSTENETEEQAAATKAQEEEFKKLERELVFPPVPESPLLAIPAWPKRDGVGEAEPAPKKKRMTKKEKEFAAAATAAAAANDANGAESPKAGNGHGADAA